MPPSTAVAKPEQTAVAASVPARVIDAVEKMGVFETLLPACYKPMAERFKARAKLYISRKPELQQCTVASLVQCVLSAAQDGLCLDGRMAHAVKFNNKKKGPDGKETWVAEATYMPDYKGILDSCRRHGAIVDGYAEHVFENDEFSFYMENGRYHHRWQPAMGDRGKYLGSFCLLLFDGGRFKVVYMSEQEIEHVRQKSKAKDNGPWVTDKPEMQKKTVFKRACKLYITDPDTADMLDRDDLAMGYETNAVTAIEAAPAKSLDEHSARKALTNQPSAPLELPVADNDFVMADPSTFTERPDEPTAETVQAQVASRQGLSKLLFDMTAATTIALVNDLERKANAVAESADDAADVANTAEQARERIRSMRGPRATGAKPEPQTSLLNEPPADVAESMAAEGIG